MTFQLRPSELSGPIRYAELARSLGVPEGGRAPLATVREAVLTLRRGKGMVLDPADPDSRSAGSFFTNPVLDDAQFAALQKLVGEDVPIPRFPAGPGQVKVPAAWLIGQAGFGKGYPGPGGVRISTKHTLALVNPGGATAADIAGLARAIHDQVRDQLGVDLACEPILVGLTLWGGGAGEGGGGGRGAGPEKRRASAASKVRRGRGRDTRRQRAGSAAIGGWRASSGCGHQDPRPESAGHGPAVGCRTDDLDVVAGVEQRRETRADQALVVGEQDADHGAGLTGRRALTRNPPPGRNPADRLPPSAVARSRMPVIPLPVPIAEPTPERAFPSSSIWMCTSASS